MIISGLVMNLRHPIWHAHFSQWHSSTITLFEYLRIMVLPHSHPFFEKQPEGT